MNIFFLSESPFEAAAMHNDMHVRKMLIESCQILCTTLHVIGEYSGEIPYKKTHENHPSVKWVRESNQNYLWLLTLSMYLLCEYEYRFEKKHKCEPVVDWLNSHLPKSLPNIPQTEFKLGFDINKYPECKHEDPIESYRLFYANHKKVWGKDNKPHTWTKRMVPFFMNN